MLVVSAPAVVSILAGAGCAYLGAVTWRRRDRPAATLWLGVVGTFALWALTYGTALLVHDPALRRLFEYPIWLLKPLAAFFLFTFGLEYSGRGDLVRSRWTLVHLGFWLVATGLYWTNPIHHLMWTGYRVEPTLGAATVTYTRQPLILAFHGAAYVVIAMMVFMLLETIYNYGRLYRVQTAALAVGVAVPTIMSPVHQLNLGPYPHLNLTPIAFFFFAVSGMYALFRRDMFDMTPVVRRVGERAAIDDLGSAVVVVDERRRVITLNDAAEDLFGVTAERGLARPLDDLLEADLSFGADELTATIHTPEGRREFVVTTSPVTDPSGARVGHTLVFQDVTDERQRKQRLEVLNRVLRHNLRNGLSVVDLYADELEATAETEERAEMAATIREKAAELVELGEKARAAARALDEIPTTVLEVEPLLGELAADLRDRYPDGTVTVDVPPDLRIESNPEVLELLFESLIENGLEHGDSDAPRVEVTLAGVDRTDGSATVRIRDNGGGIPEHELAVLESGEESALEHGSGLGLWLVRWSVRTLGGTVAFDPDADGTTVTVRLPGLQEESLPSADVGEG